VKGKFLGFNSITKSRFFVPKGKCMVSWTKKWQEFLNLQVYVSFVFFQTIRFFLIKLQKCIDSYFLKSMKMFMLVEFID
jgi:hypothetical protein